MSALFLVVCVQVSQQGNLGAVVDHLAVDVQDEVDHGAVAPRSLCGADGTLEVDGVFDGDTRRAVVDWQEATWQQKTGRVTRSDMVAAGWSPSVRLFEAAACETPLISDAWPGLESFFPVGESIHVARSAVEVVDIPTRETEPARRRIAASARRRVLDADTADARAREFLAGLWPPVRRAARGANAVEAAA